MSKPSTMLVSMHALVEAAGTEPKLDSNSFKHGSVSGGVDDALMNTTVIDYAEKERWKLTPTKWARVVEEAISTLRAVDDWLRYAERLGQEAQRLKYRLPDDEVKPTPHPNGDASFVTAAGERAIELITDAADHWKPVGQDVRLVLNKARKLVDAPEVDKFLMLKPSDLRVVTDNETMAVAAATRLHSAGWADFGRDTAEFDPGNIGNDLLGHVVSLKYRRERDEKHGLGNAWVEDAVYLHASGLDTDHEGSGGKFIEDAVRPIAESLAWVVIVLPRLAAAMERYEQGKLRAALAKGKEVKAADLPKTKLKDKAWKWEPGHKMLALAQKLGLKAKAGELPAETKRIIKSLKEVAAEMEDIEEKWRTYNAASGEEAEKSSKLWRDEMERRLAAGEKYADIRIRTPDSAWETVNRVAHLQNDVMVGISNLHPKLANVVGYLGDIRGGERGEFDDPMDRLRRALTDVHRMVAYPDNISHKWREYLKPFQLAVSMSLDAKTPEGQEALRKAYADASWKLDGVYRGNLPGGPRTEFPTVRDALKIAAELLPYVHGAAAFRAEQNPGDFIDDAGKVGPWDIKVWVPAGYRKDRLTTFASTAGLPPLHDVVATTKRIAEFALKAYRRIGVKDRAIAGPVVIKFRDPDNSEDEKGAAGYYHHSDGRVTIFHDVLGLSIPDREAGDVGFLDATWTFIHEIAHRVYYKGLTTNARNYWHTLVQKMGDPMSESMRKLCIAVAAADGARKLGDDVSFPEGANDDLRVHLKGEGASFSPKAVIAAANDKDKAFAETIWWWYRDRHPREQFLDWLKAKRYTKELPTEYSNVTPTEAWPESVANALLKRPRTKELRDTSPFIRAIVHQLLGQVRESIYEAAATLTRKKPPTKKRKKKMPKPDMDQLLQSQHVEQVATVGPVRVSVVMRDERMFVVDPTLSPKKYQAAKQTVHDVGGVVAWPSSYVGDVVDKVKQAVAIMRKGGIPDRTLSTRVVFDFTRRIDAYADADYSPDRDVVVAKVSVDVPTIIHELAHRVWFKGLGSQGRKTWLAFIDSIGEPLPEKIQAVAFALALREEWQTLEDQATSQDDFNEMWVATMTRLERFMNDRSYLYAGMPIEEYDPQKVIDNVKTTPTDFTRANTMWLSFALQHSTSPRQFGEWLAEKKYTTKLPSAYANTDEAEAWAEAVMDTLFSRWNGLDPHTHALVRLHVMRALKQVREVREVMIPLVALQEQVVATTGGLGLSRDELPQIDSDRVDDFLAWLREQGVAVWPTPATARLLKPSQGELESDKVDALKRTPEKLTAGKIITSMDGYVLDGHHRWAAFVDLYPEGSLETWQAALPIRELIALVMKYPGAKVKDITESLEEVSFTAVAPGHITWYGDTAKFEVEGTEYRVRMTGSGRTREVIFEALTPNGWTTGITGTGSPIKVLSAVIAAAADYVYARQAINSLVFTARGRGRIGTYSKMVKLLARKFSWKMRETIDSEHGVFALGKTAEAAEEALAAKARVSRSFAVKGAEKRIAALQAQTSRLRAASTPVMASMGGMFDALLAEADTSIGAGAHAQFTNPSGEKFWGAQGAGVLPIARATGRVLVSFRSKYVNEPHTWGVFGGAIDKGEDPKRAATREMQEELGCCRDVDLVPGFVFVSSGGGFKYYNFLGLVDDEFKPKLDWETEKAEWMTWGELAKLHPKHFGLEALIKNSGSLLRKHITAESILSRTAYASPLFERSFTEKDIPEHFFLLTNMDRALPGLKQGVLSGVKGIAADGRVVASIGASDGGLILSMPGADTVKLNKLSRVMYDNPEYWVQDDFKAAKRILNSNTGKSAGDKILHAAHEWARKKGIGVLGGIREFPYEFGEWGSEPVRNLGTWARRLVANVRALQKKRGDGNWPLLDDVAKLSEKDWMAFIKLGTDRLAKRFHIEGEWIVKDEKLRLPPTTELRVMIEDDPVWSMVTEEALSQLEGKFRVERIPEDDWKSFVKMMRDEEMARWKKVYNEAAITEVFDKPYEFKIKRVNADFRDATFEVPIEPGTGAHIGYEVNISRLTDPKFFETMNVWELHFNYTPRLSSPGVVAKFGQKDSFAVLGAGNAARVFATVVAFVKDTKKLRKIEGMLIGAKEQSRRRLYRAMLTRFAREQGWKLTSTMEHRDLAQSIDADETFEWFLIGKQEKLDDIVLRAKEYVANPPEEEPEDEYEPDPDDNMDDEPEEPEEEQPHDLYLYSVVPASALSMSLKAGKLTGYDFEWYGGHQYNYLREEFDGVVRAANAERTTALVASEAPILVRASVGDHRWTSRAGGWELVDERADMRFWRIFFRGKWHPVPIAVDVFFGPGVEFALDKTTDRGNGWEAYHSIESPYWPQRRDMEESVRAPLAERSFVLSDIPEVFRVVFDLGTSEEYGDARAWKSLAMGKLVGVRGISDSGFIEPQFFDVARNAELVMPGKALASLNKVTRILYDNPNYMLSKDAWALRRVFQASTYSREEAISHTIHNLLEYMASAIKKAGTHRPLIYSWEYTAMHQSLARDIAKRGKKIDGVKSFIAVIRDALKSNANPSHSEHEVAEYVKDWPDAEWEKWIKAAIQKIAQVYSDEGEWVVKGDGLTIPPNSTLRVLVGNESGKEIPDDVWKRYVRIFGSKLGTKPALFGGDLPPEENGPWDMPGSFVGWESLLAERGYLLDRLMKLGITKKYRVEFVKRSDFKATRKRWFDARDAAKRDDPTPAYHPPEGAAVESAQGRAVLTQPRTRLFPLDGLR